MDAANTRRQFLRISALAGSGLALTACRNRAAPEKTEEADKKNEEGAEVTATEDLMREHGVLRRARLVYAETVPKLRREWASPGGPASRPYGIASMSYGTVWHSVNKIAIVKAS